MKHETSKNKVITSLFWKLSQTISTQVISFGLTMILARLLSPSDYGIIGLITIYINISTIFITGGFGNSLIRKKDIDDEDLSSVFYIYLVFSAFFYAVLFFMAPFIARFYGKPILVPILRVLGINLFPGSINSIQQALVARRLMFKMFFWRSITALTISGAVGLTMAYLGYGVWSLVGMQCTSAFVGAFVLWFTVKWRPKLVFSMSKARELFSYGYKLLISNLVTTVYNSLYGLIIGKIYDTTTLGYYTRGQQFPTLIMGSVDGTISSIMLPTLSAMQDDKTRLKATMRKAISGSSFLLNPLMIGLAVIAEPLVSVLLGEKWIPCVPFLQMSCFAYIFWPMQTTNVKGLQALGRSDLFLKLGFIKRAVGITLLLISIKFGVHAMMMANVMTQIIGCFIHAKPNKKLLRYGIREQVMDILPALGISVIMAAAIFPLKYLVHNDIVLLATQIISGGLIYLLISKLFKVDALHFILIEAKNLIGKKKKVS